MSTHVPVLLDATLELLAVKAGGHYFDATVGLGGHAEAILAASAPDGRLTGVDRDPETVASARERLARFSDRAVLEACDYRKVAEQLGRDGATYDGIVIDLGVNSAQLDSGERGFSFRRDGPLDMRFDRTGGETAAETVNGMPEAELADLIYAFGEERASRRIARAIVRAREQAPIETTARLAEIVRRACRGPRRRIDPATRTFQALRIYVNRELDGLGVCLSRFAEALAPGGRLVVIAFHSLEDRIAKRTLRDLDRQRFCVLTKKPVRASETERRANPRSRSARARAVVREAA